MEKQFEELKSEICKEVCEYLRNRKVEEGIIAVTGVKIMAYGNSSRVELPVGVLSEPLSCEQVRLNTIEECAQHLESLAIKSNDLLVEERHILQEDTVELFRNDIEYLRQLANSLRKLASKS